MKIGIDKIGFYTPAMYIDTGDLAEARGVEPGKFKVGIGQEKMAVAPKTQDSVTLAANAALRILTQDDIDKIDYVIFATETGVDHSKAAGIFAHDLLGLKKSARSIEIKQACYSATAGIQIAKGHVALNPDSRVLVLASDISRYGLNTGGEITQGAGAVAMVIARDPKLMTIESPSVYQTDDAMDFWRPLYSDTAYVQGKFSVIQYINFFKELFAQYQEKTQTSLKDFEALVFHTPYTKMGLKALQAVLEDADEADKKRLLDYYEVAKHYNAIVGNIYTGSLYLNLISLLEQNNSLEDGATIGLFSYGSGSVGEFFTGVLQPDYRNHLLTEQHVQMLEDRKQISIDRYEKVFMDTIPNGIGDIELDIEADPAPICLAGIKDHMRQYVNKNHL
ncbi:hydroxymethylglutaryl-CoA synthase [Amphibacillus xylanus]|uniref:Hydroxymethylglutaryl-CoA synthase n=1 Tax=Amphibacillus xylanus (strain ATCC 51415 / DSM 6626 / JCM 7361 / LMG 17667 / NBRC 15112 / Ep01) TaxID=698758 RepID=K0J2T3_AMPXN|nr:hydroxymethylglutaryl-CoA synthase [Amphibacillus xylanus]BAM47447.1 hydroxymethylglutaryl-CoA synthase [Amphibacillus xylanus NBRC 15112]